MLQMNLESSLDSICFLDINIISGQYILKTCYCLAQISHKSFMQYIKEKSRHKRTSICSKQTPRKVTWQSMLLKSWP